MVVVCLDLLFCGVTAASATVAAHGELRRAAELPGPVFHLRPPMRNGKKMRVSGVALSFIIMILIVNMIFIIFFIIYYHDHHSRALHHLNSLLGSQCFSNSTFQSVFQSLAPSCSAFHPVVSLCLATPNEGTPTLWKGPTSKSHEKRRIHQLTHSERVNTETTRK